jgi:hypothetical protein
VKETRYDQELHKILEGEKGRTENRKKSNVMYKITPSYHYRISMPLTTQNVLTKRD